MPASIVSITGLQQAINLETFIADYNGLDFIDLSNLPNLKFVNVSNCDIPGTNTSSLTSVNLSGSTSITELRLNDSDFSGGLPDISALELLERIDLDQCNLFGEIDLSNLSSITSIDLFGNTNLTSVTLSSLQPIASLIISECSLTQAAVDDILITMNIRLGPGGEIYLNGGTNAAPGPLGTAVIPSLEEKGWQILVNS